MKIPLTYLLALLSFPLLSQIERSKDDFTLEAIINYTHFNGFGSKESFGLQGELMLSGYFGFQMSAAGTHDYVTFNGPALLVPMGILIGDSRSSARDIIQLIEIIFWACAVENPALHIRINDRVELITYASLCRIRYWWNETQPFASSWIASGSLGFKFSYSFAKNYYASFCGEYSQLYYSGRPGGFQLGISIGRVLKSKN